MRNRVFTISFAAFIALVSVLSFLNAETETKTKQDFNTVLGALTTVENEIDRELNILDQYFTLNVVYNKVRNDFA